MAHPYAPLGGCYDDPVVGIVAAELLKQGFVVGTFNFRGALGSAGRTSWTAKPERSDYMSFIGFMVYYVHFLDPFGSKETASPISKRSPTPPEAHSKLPQANEPLFLLGGYSYGAMITTQIPPMDRILGQFASPAVGSAAADIRLRAQHLAEHQNVILASAMAAQSTSPRKLYMSMRVGGNEDSQRKSHDSRRSFSLDAEERIRRGVNELLAKTKRHHHREPAVAEEDNTGQEEGTTTLQGAAPVLEAVAGLVQVRPAYLLVSPLQGMITHLATMSFLPISTGRGLFTKAATKPRNQGAPTFSSDHRQLSEAKLVKNATLALFGDKDGFVSVAKLRSWVQRLEAADGSRFHGEEIASAGHFWTENKVAYVLRQKVADFAARLVLAEKQNPAMVEA
ncbi:hypothetical protein Cob_v008008 [Colletotrichum orbiculare MAFF 240422]|uniref:Uncharacterized protein n=1 Tax=Colletotrichum orbiculare (strain 104-T / ATCC 96160 / CBS 514.97 / LARS 414 / MAFF 240422) TaxID=1213857 RepID=N4VCV4_COLOR|nr:hypothetical protein Cob_v008008 [Colletotrichum orbiculare MAFF 240422]